MRQSLKRFTKKKKLLEALQKEGWRIELNKHYKCYCPCGEHLLVTPQSTSDYRGLQNFISDLARTNCEALP